MFKLYAVRDEDRRFLGEFATLDQCADEVDVLEEDEGWPEGFEAVAVDDTTDREYLYTGEWGEV